MALPPVDAVFEHLCALRDAERPTDPEHDAHWRAVARWLEQAFPGRSTEQEDARQEALVSLMRHVPWMRAESPLQAAKWMSTIVRRKKVDAHRTRKRDPVERALRRERATELGPTIDRVAHQEEPAALVRPEAIDQVVARALEQVHLALEETEPNAAKRQLRRTQAQATLLRLVSNASAEEIEKVLDYGEPIEKDRLYKWVERGRAVVLLGMDRWERDDPAAIDVIDTFREIVGERRADAGLPRLDRRRDREDEA